MSANILVPEVGESIVDARVAKWLKKEGDLVAAGDPLVELETDKIDLEVAAPQAGVLTRIDHRDGADVKVGEVLGVIDEVGRGVRCSGGEGCGTSRKRKLPTAIVPGRHQPRAMRRSRTKWIWPRFAAAETPAA